MIVALAAVVFLLPGRGEPEPEEPAAPLSGSGYPVPPLDLQVPPTPPRRQVPSGAEDGSKEGAGSV